MTRVAPYVSVIIPTYNRSKMLPLTLDSFLAQDYPKERYEIIVADNNSTDDTQFVLKNYSARWDQIRTLLETRQGVHYARNHAAQKSRGEILYFTDDDMIADPGLLTELVRVFDLDPRIGSATGRIIGQFESPPPDWVKKHLINQYLSLTEPDRPDEVLISSDDMIFSCHEAIRREAFFVCGGFNPENTAGVWIGDGETGLGIKLKKAGYKFAYTPRSMIYHQIPKSRTTVRYLIKRIGNQGNCDSYTEYREHRSLKRLLWRLLKRNTIGFACLIRTTLVNILRKRESWHFLPARIAYVYRRTLYDLKLVANAEFRRVVEIDDWLERGERQVLPP